jgi:hypothetical protein
LSGTVKGRPVPSVTTLAPIAPPEQRKRLKAVMRKRLKHVRFIVFVMNAKRLTPETSEYAPSLAVYRRFFKWFSVVRP